MNEQTAASDGTLAFDSGCERRWLGKDRKFNRLKRLAQREALRRENITARSVERIPVGVIRKELRDPTLGRVVAVRTSSRDRDRRSEAKVH
jgi:hypothetical protein